MRLGDNLSPKSRRIAASITLLALMIQPFYGFIQSPTAYAASSSVVSPDAMHGWQVGDPTGNGGSVNFANSIASAGLGSAQFSLPGINQTQSLQLSTYGSTKLADLSTLAYDTYVYTGTTAAPSLRLAIDKDVTDSDTSSQGYLVYSPYQNGSVVAGQWQHQNARDGLWWFSDASNLTCSQLSPCSLNAIITLYPHIGISSGGIDLTSSNSGGEPSTSNVDTLMVNDDSFNFEAISAPQLISPTATSIQSDPTLVSKWQAVPTASKYIYESYNDEAATQLRVHEVATDTQKSETNVADGTSWWRVKAIDQQGNEGGWSDLWKVIIGKRVAAGSGIVSGNDSGQTQELLTQMARLNEPFTVPSSLDTFIAPHVLNNAIDTAGDSSSVQQAHVAVNPVADHGVSTAAAVPTENGWKFFGVLWYWWIVPVLITGFILARIANRPARRPFLYSSDQV
ncbi:MAG: hypothetical protein JWP06_50 [Candidatus Saccharibacteria bacterium]|nr:hypothetical protein [Candidatus Saccharibacteria bacterium]